MSLFSLKSAAATALILLSALTGTALIVLNPGLYWDDWVWRFTSNEEFIRLGQELGLWWIGRLSIAIWSLQDPVLAMRLTSLIGWLASGAAIALLLVRLNIAERSESLLWMALYCACHLSLIRFIPSVAMYVVYIAAFWIAWALIAYFPRQSWSRASAAILLLVAFHLPSMIVLYGVLVLWLLWDEYRSSASPGNSVTQPQLPAGAERPPPRLFEPFVRSRPVQIALAVFRANTLVILSPVIFTLLVKLPSAVLIKTSQEPVNFYSRYNFFNPLDLLLSLPRALAYVPKVIAEYISLPRTMFGYIAVLALFVTLLLLMTLAAGAAQRPRAKRAFIQLAAGLFLVLCGVFPYFVVGKPPILAEFYEGRHILVALPGVCLVFVALAGLFAAMLPARMPDWAAVGMRNAVAAMIIALSLTQTLSFSLSLLVDWLRQQTIIEYVRDNREKIDSFGLVIFNEETERLKVSERYIWNYEYTGMLLSVFGKQTHMGISKHEYVTSSVSSPLFHHESYRRRYHAREFDFNAPHLILSIENGEGAQKLSARKAVGGLADYWARRPIRYADLDIVRIRPSMESREADHTMVALKTIAQALEKFRSDNGYYPLTTRDVPVETKFGRLSVDSLMEQPKPPEVLINGDGKAKGKKGEPKRTAKKIEPEDEAPVKWHLQLAPKYIERNQLLFGCRDFDDHECGVLYISNGVDYKLLKWKPRDVPYARQAYGEFFDVKRQLYGLWTDGARNW